MTRYENGLAKKQNAIVLSMKMRFTDLRQARTRTGGRPDMPDRHVGGGPPELL